MGSEQSGLARSPRSWVRGWREARRRRSEQDKKWLELARRHSALVAELRAQSDYDSYEGFYSENEERRGDDVCIGTIADDQLEWTVNWLPGTREVVAFPDRWSDEDAHQLRSPGVSGSWPGPAPVPLVFTAPLPTLVHVLGRAESAEQARTRIASAANLDAARAALS